MSKEDQETEQMRHDFERQLEKLKAKEAIIGNSTFNEAAWKQRNPSFRADRVKDLFYGVIRARQIREKDLEEL